MIRRPPRSTSAATLLPDPTLFRSLWLLYLPLLVPQVAFLSGITVVSVYFSAAPAWWLVMLGHLLFVLPYVFLTLSEAYRRLDPRRSEEHTSELQSLMRISYAVFCLKNNKTH